MGNTTKGMLIAGVLGAAVALPNAAQAVITVSDAGGGTAGAYFETQLAGFPGYVPITLTPYSPTDDNGFHNGRVDLTPGVYRFEYWGSGDSAFDNLFTLNPSPNYSVTSGTGAINSIGPGGTGGYGAPFEITVTAATQLLFTYSTSGPPECSAQTGGSTEECDFLAATEGYVSGGGTQYGFRAYLGFSDRNEGVDHDHQDLTIRISEIPEPATLALLGSGLFGLGMIRRRRLA